MSQILSLDQNLDQTIWENLQSCICFDTCNDYPELYEWRNSGYLFNDIIQKYISDNILVMNKRVKKSDCINYHLKRIKLCSYVYRDKNSTSGDIYYISPEIDSCEIVSWHMSINEINVHLYKYSDDIYQENDEEYLRKWEEIPLVRYQGILSFDELTKYFDNLSSSEKMHFCLSFLASNVFASGK